MNYYREERAVRRDKLTEGQRVKPQKTVREDGTPLIGTPMLQARPASALKSSIRRALTRPWWNCEAAGTCLINGQQNMSVRRLTGTRWANGGVKGKEDESIDKLNLFRSSWVCNCKSSHALGFHTWGVCLLEWTVYLQKQLLCKCPLSGIFVFIFVKEHAWETVTAQFSEKIFIFVGSLSINPAIKNREHFLLTFLLSYKKHYFWMFSELSKCPVF